jgi:hypothetical protein
MKNYQPFSKGALGESEAKRATGDGMHKEPLRVAAYF